jgi:hypothetical protein
MTTLLEQAFSEASKLRTPEQDMLAQWLLELLTSEQQWNELFAKSQDVLTQLANEALTEYRQGKTRILHPDSL